MITMADQNPFLWKRKKGTLCTIELGKLVDAQYGIYTRNRDTRQITLLRTAKSTDFSDLKGANSKTFWSAVCSLNNSAHSIPTL